MPLEPPLSRRATLSRPLRAQPRLVRPGRARLAQHPGRHEPSRREVVLLHSQPQRLLARHGRAVPGAAHDAGRSPRPDGRAEGQCNRRAQWRGGRAGPRDPARRARHLGADHRHRARRAPGRAHHRRHAGAGAEQDGREPGPEPRVQRARRDQRDGVGTGADARRRAAVGHDGLESVGLVPPRQRPRRVQYSGPTLGDIGVMSLSVLFQCSSGGH